MNCGQIPDYGWDEITSIFGEMRAKTNMPIVGTIDPTHRCNLKCPHCYCADREDNTGLAPRESELSADEIKRVIDQFVDAGGMWLNFSGGEIFYRRDFLDIYRHAKERGVYVALLTNGTTITEKIADALAEYPPRLIEITLYGGTAETFDMVTGVPGAFDRCIEGVRRLVARGLNVKLKTILMRENAHEFGLMKELANELVGTDQMRYDAMIFPRLDRSTGSCHSRLSPQEIVGIEAADEQISKSWTEYIDQDHGKKIDPNRLFTCGAGQSTFYLGPEGALYPCIMMREVKLDLHDRVDDFMGAYDEINGRIRAAKTQGEQKCTTCDNHSICGQCPGWTSLEHGEADIRPIDYLCEVATLRVETFKTKPEPPPPALVQLTRPARVERNGGATL